MDKPLFEGITPEQSEKLFGLGRTYINNLNIEARMKEMNMSDEERESIMKPSWDTFWAALKEAGFTKEQIKVFVKHNEMDLQLAEAGEQIYWDRLSRCLHYINAQIVNESEIRHLFPHLEGVFLEVDEEDICQFAHECEDPVGCKNFTECPEDIAQTYMMNTDGGAFRPDMNKEKWDKLHPGDKHPLDELGEDDA